MKVIAKESIILDSIQFILFSESTNANDEFMVSLNRKLSSVNESPKQNRDRTSAGYQTIDVRARERSPIIRDNSTASDDQTIRQVSKDHVLFLIQN